MNLLANLVHQTSAQKFDIDFIHKICFKFLQRLDDNQNHLRVLSAKVRNILYFNIKYFTFVEKNSIIRNIQVCGKLLEYLSILSKQTGYDTILYGAHTEHYISVLLLHLDDEDESVQDAVQNALIKMNLLDPERLTKSCQNDLKKLTNTKRIEKILEL